MKKILLSSSIALILFAVITIVPLIRDSAGPEGEMSSVYKTVSAVNDALYKVAGLEMTHIEKAFVPIKYEHAGGGYIKYQQFYCSDPEKIKSGEVSALNDVFDSKTADDVQDVFVNGEPASLYKKDNRAYLIWYPSETIILLISYDPDIVSKADIIKMAESCG